MEQQDRVDHQDHEKKPETDSRLTNSEEIAEGAYALLPSLDIVHVNVKDEGTTTSDDSGARVMGPDKPYPHTEAAKATVASLPPSNDYWKPVEQVTTHEQETIKSITDSSKSKSRSILSTSLSKISRKATGVGR